jgi:hypothetical protein
MRVKFFSSFAVAFDDYRMCAKIEGPMFQILLKSFASRKTTSPSKSDNTIIREIVEGWPRGWLDWVEIAEANK